jgi:hypothetical protein
VAFGGREMLAGLVLWSVTVVKVRGGKIKCGLRRRLRLATSVDLAESWRQITHPPSDIVALNLGLPKSALRNRRIVG